MLAAALLAVVVVGAPGASAQIESKRAEAAAVAAKLEQQARSIVLLDKEHRRAQGELAVAEAAVDRAQDELALAARQAEEARRLLTVYAQMAYVGGGSVSFLGRMARASVDDAAARRTYLQIASGEDRQALERLRATQEDLGARQASLADARRLAAERAGATGADRNRLQQAMGAQRALLERTRGELATLVAAEQARRDAESERAAASRAPATTAPAPGRAAPATTAAPTPRSTPSSSVDETFACIRQLESGNNYSIGGGGAYQFQDGTWQSLGYKGSAQDHPPEVQDEAARKLLARDGWTPWTTAPACGRV